MVAKEAVAKLGMGGGGEYQPHGWPAGVAAEVAIAASVDSAGAVTGSGAGGVVTSQVVCADKTKLASEAMDVTFAGQHQHQRQRQPER
jgi:hypothetical protein